MSKEAAMALATGQPVVQPIPLSAETTAVDAPKPVEQSIESDRFAKIAAREAKLQQDRELYKTEQQQMYEEKQKLKSIKDKLDAFEAKKKDNPIEALKELGFKEEDIVNFLADSQPKELTTEEKATLAAQAEIKKFQDEQKAKEESLAKDRDEKAVKAYRSEITKFIEVDKEKLPYCNFYGPVAEELAYETVLTILREDKNPPPPHELMKEAVGLVEQMYLQEAEELAKLKQPKTEAPAAVIKEAPLKPEMPGRSRVIEKEVLKKPVSSISNKAAATSASSIPKKETPEQKRERLMNWLRSGKQA